MNRRLVRLRMALKEKELDAILISTEENRRYISGFRGSTGYLLVSQDAAVLATDFRYIEQAGRQAPDFQVERIVGGFTWLPKLASVLQVGRIGFESQHMSYSAYMGIKNDIDSVGTLLKPEMIPTTGIVRSFSSSSIIRRPRLRWQKTRSRPTSFLP